MNKVILFPFHIKFDLMKNFMKAKYKNDVVFHNYVPSS